MAQDRNIADCAEVLRVAFGIASSQWMTSNPDAPIPFITESHRSNEDQQIDYNKGRKTTGPIVTWAKPGQSPHNYLPSFAFDVAFKRKDGSIDWNVNNFKEFAKLLLAASPQIVWGGNFPKPKQDNPHFEVKNWPTLIPKTPK